MNDSYEHIEREKWKSIILASFIEAVEKNSGRTGMSIRASFVYMWALYDLFCSSIYLNIPDLNKDILSSAIVQAKKTLAEEFKGYIEWREK